MRDQQQTPSTVVLAKSRTGKVPRRVSNVILLVVLGVVLLTGVGSWLAGTPEQRWVVVSHGVAGVLVVLLVRWKAPVIRSGWTRSRRSRWASAALGLLTVLALLTGLLHSTGLVTAVGGQRTMWWHVAFGFGLLPLLAWHARSRRQRIRRTDLGRRFVLRNGLLVLAAGALWVAAEGTVRLTGLAGARRRFTGSYPTAAPQPTIWLFDAIPDVDPSTWTLTVTGNGRPRVWSVADLRHHPPMTVRAVIDCTSGWYSTQEWSGVPLSSLVSEDLDGRSVVVRSRTGYSRRFAAEEVGTVLLAHSLAGEPLPRQLGAPLRLVVPGRRGFWWVKWVDRIEVDDRPSWWQPTFPLQ